MVFAGKVDALPRPRLAVLLRVDSQRFRDPISLHVDFRSIDKSVRWTVKFRLSEERTASDDTSSLVSLFFTVVLFR